MKTILSVLLGSMNPFGLANVLNKVLKDYITDITAFRICLDDMNDIIVVPLAKANFLGKGRAVRIPEPARDRRSCWSFQLASPENRIFMHLSQSFVIVIRAVGS